MTDVPELFSSNQNLTWPIAEIDKSKNLLAVQKQGTMSTGSRQDTIGILHLIPFWRDIRYRELWLLKPYPFSLHGSENKRKPLLE